MATKVHSSLQVTSVVKISREPPSKLRVPYQSARGRSPSASSLMHDRPFHGPPQPYDEPWRRFHDAQLLCYARLLPCGCPLESIFRLCKHQAIYEPLDFIVRSSLRPKAYPENPPPLPQQSYWAKLGSAQECEEVS